MGYFNADRSGQAARGLHAPKPGLNAVGEYQVSGRPYLKTILFGQFTFQIDAAVTVSADLANTTVSFPFVTSRLIVNNHTDRDIAVYFCSTATTDGDNVLNSGVRVNKNYFVIPKGEAGFAVPTLDARIKTRKVYLATFGAATPTSGHVSVMAELTNIEEPYDCDVDNIDGVSG
tara:strand:+ start:42 stop:563 length:522 start_codon:yes stop_codon:yes gene_type:complete